MYLVNPGGTNVALELVIDHVKFVSGNAIPSLVTVRAFRIASPPNPVLESKEVRILNSGLRI
jgi:hypothetical protein